MAAQYQRIPARRGKKCTLIALGHTILVIVYTLLTRKQPYQDLGAAYFDSYRAIDKDGHLVDVHLSETRDLAATEAFFRCAWTVTGIIPDQIITDGHDAYPVPSGTSSGTS